MTIRIGLLRLSKAGSRIVQAQKRYLLDKFISLLSDNKNQSVEHILLYRLDMEQGGNELIGVKEDQNASMLSLTRLEYRKYAVHYHNLRQSAISEIEDCISSGNFSKEKNQGLALPQTSRFCHKILTNDSSYQLERKQSTDILKEIVKMFQLEISRILKDQNNQYHRISEQNCKILKYTNRLNVCTEPYCSPQRLIKIEILGLFIQKNYEYEQCEAFPIQKLIPIKIIKDILKLPSISSIYLTHQTKWIDNYHFIDQQSKESYFVMLINIICLLFLKRKLSIKGKCSNFDDTYSIFLKTSKPKQRYLFENCEKFKFKFCEIAAFSSGSFDIENRKSSIRKHINRKIKEFFQLESDVNLSHLLKFLMLQYNLNFRTLAEWINRKSNEEYNTQEEIKETVEKYQWTLGINNSLLLQLKSNTNKKVQTRDILFSQNFIGESLCKIALQRLNTYAVVLSIQNKLMAKVDSQPPLYIRRLRYSYEQYYRIHHPHPSSQGNRKKKQTIFSIILGFFKEINVFTFKFDEELTQYGYVEHLIAFFKAQQDIFKNIVLSEMDFERIGLIESSLRRIIDFFLKSFNSFVKFEGSPIKIFCHLLVHSYVDKCLRQTSFESKEEFSLLLSASILRIIKIINHSQETKGLKQRTYQEQFQEQSGEQSLNEELYQDSSRIFFENCSNFSQYCPKLDFGKIQEKVEAIFKRRQSMTVEELQSVEWRGKHSFHMKGAKCEYYLFKERNIRIKKELKMQNLFKNTLSRDSFTLEQQAKDISNCVLKTLRKDWPFLTSQQIQKEISDLVEFRKKKNTGIDKIKALLRGIARTLLIYQVYFNQYFLNEKARPEIQEKYSHHLLFLSQTYENETNNINRLYPGQIEMFYFRLLQDLTLFPTTFKTINANHGSLSCKKQQLQKK